MRVLNAMFSPGLGGIEQAFLDYCVALRAEQNQVSALIRPNPDVERILKQLRVEHAIIDNMGKWDPFAVKHIRRQVEIVNPDIIITHGRRAFQLIRKAVGNRCPVVAVAHNYQISDFSDADAVISVTRDLDQALGVAGIPETRRFVIPNMIRPTYISEVRSQWNNPPVIGTLGRFVEKKGFDILLHALAELKQRQVPFQAIIAGDGEERKPLYDLASQLGIWEQVIFPGWITDKRNFFSKIDLFCLPSRHEPFGIVLIEAFAHGVPSITTDTEGPSEIATNHHDALIVPRDNPNVMSHALEELMMYQPAARKLARNALETVKQRYDISVVSKQLSQSLRDILTEHCRQL